MKKKILPYFSSISLPSFSSDYSPKFPRCPLQRHFERKKESKETEKNEENTQNQCSLEGEQPGEYRSGDERKIERGKSQLSKIEDSMYRDKIRV